MNRNKFELIGKVNYVNCTAKENGTIYTRGFIGQKGRGEEFKSTDFVCFNDVAEKFAEEIKKGDIVNIVGHIQLNDKKSDDGKIIFEKTLVVYEFQKVKYDENVKHYVPFDDNGKDVPWD